MIITFHSAMYCIGVSIFVVLCLCSITFLGWFALSIANGIRWFGKNHFEQKRTIKELRTALDVETTAHEMTASEFFEYDSTGYDSVEHIIQYNRRRVIEEADLSNQ